VGGADDLISKGYHETFQVFDSDESSELDLSPNGNRLSTSVRGEGRKRERERKEQLKDDIDESISSLDRDL
jgi:hypothetical protein